MIVVLKPDSYDIYPLLFMRRILLLIVLIIIAFLAWYSFKEYNRTNKDLKAQTADVTINAPDLISAFEKDSSKANKTYIDKIVAVTGNVKKIDADGNPVIIFLSNENQMSSVKCSMDSTHASDYKAIKPGTTITIKGKCTGGQTDDLFGTDVTLNFCVLENNK